MIKHDGDTSVATKEQDALYREFREVCGPPMMKLALLDIGELWFYDGLAWTRCV